MVFAVIAAWRLRGIARGRATQRDAAATAGVLVAALVLAIPALKGASTYVNVTNGVLSQAANLGNLAAPLSHWQVLGVWPSGDFRFPVVTHYRLAFALQGVVIVGALLGAIWLVRRRALRAPASAGEQRADRVDPARTLWSLRGGQGADDRLHPASC